MKNTKFFRCLAFLGLATTLLGTACSGADKSITFTVSFDTGGGSTVASQTVANTDKATKPSDPTRSGYTFENWYADSKCVTVFEFDKMPITADWTIYANWTLNETPDDPTPGSETPTGVVYKITGLPTWIQDDGCVIFAWAWADGENGEWYSFTYSDDGDWGTFETSKEMAGMLLARCAAGTTLPNWQQTEHTAGRVYNQTNDITITSGQTTFTCNTWKDYNPQ